MRTRSEWFLAGARGGSLEMSTDNIHLRPPGQSAAGALAVAGIGAYRSHDDLTNYRNDNFIINHNVNSDFVVASSILSSSLSAFANNSTDVNHQHEHHHHNHHYQNSNHFHQHLQNHHNHHHHHRNRHHNHHLSHQQIGPHAHSNGGVVMMFFTVLDMLF